MIPSNCRQHSAWAWNTRVVQQSSASMLLSALCKEGGTSRLVLLSGLVLIVNLVHVIQKSCIWHTPLQKLRRMSSTVIKFKVMPPRQ